MIFPIISIFLIFIVLTDEMAVDSIDPAFASLRHSLNVGGNQVRPSVISCRERHPINERCANDINRKIYVKMSVFHDRELRKCDIFATFASRLSW